MLAAGRHRRLRLPGATRRRPGCSIRLPGTIAAARRHRLPGGPPAGLPVLRRLVGEVQGTDAAVRRQPRVSDAERVRLLRLLRRSGRRPRQGVLQLRPRAAGMSWRSTATAAVSAAASADRRRSGGFEPTWPRRVSAARSRTGTTRSSAPAGTAQSPGAAALGRAVRGRRRARARRSRPPLRALRAADPTGGLDWARGIRQFTVGTGGKNHTPLARQGEQRGPERQHVRGAAAEPRRGRRTAGGSSRRRARRSPTPAPASAARARSAGRLDDQLRLARALAAAVARGGVAERRQGELERAVAADRGGDVDLDVAAGGERRRGAVERADLGCRLVRDRGLVEGGGEPCTSKPPRSRCWRRSAASRVSPCP